MIAVITGAGSGIGAAAALELAKRGYRLVLVGRTPEKLAGVADRIASVTETRPATINTDFASLDQVRYLADQLLRRYDDIHVLINNAGVMTSQRRITADGHELIMQVNHLAPFLLTNLLFDRLKFASARVISTSSIAAYSGTIDPSDLSRERRWWNSWLQYFDSKQANALFTVSLAERGLNATCFHPGVVRTPFAGDTLTMKLMLMIPGLAKPPATAAARLVHLVTHDDGINHPGRFFMGNGPAWVPRRMKDPELAEALWEASCAATGLR